MDLKDAVGLIDHNRISENGPTTWADLGCGDGLFTNALATCLMPASKIYAVDRKPNVLNTSRIYEGVEVENITADFTGPLPISNLEGILMANSLHFVSDKQRFLKKCSQYFKADELFLFVEYNTDTPNRWVPFPISFVSLRQLFLSLNFRNIEIIGKIPSRFHGEIYASLVSR